MNQEESEQDCILPKWDPVPQGKSGAVQCHHCMTGYTTDYLMFANAVFLAMLSHGTYKPKVYA